MEGDSLAEAVGVMEMEGVALCDTEAVRVGVAVEEGVLEEVGV